MYFIAQQKLWKLDIITKAMEKLNKSKHDLKFTV